MDDTCQVEQFGTDAKARVLGIVQIDFQLDSLANSQQIDQSALLDEAGLIRNREDMTALQFFVQFPEPGSACLVDKKHVARPGADVGQGGEVQDSNAATTDGFIGDGPRQFGAKWIRADDSDREILIIRGKRLLGPLDEIGQVVEENRLDLVLAEGFTARGRGEGGQPDHERHPAKKQPWAQADWPSLSNGRVCPAMKWIVPHKSGKLG